MARDSPELPPVRVSRNERDRTVSTGRTVRQLLVHGWEGEAGGGGQGARNTSHRGDASGGGQGRSSEMSVLPCVSLFCAVSYIPCYIMPNGHLISKYPLLPELVIRTPFLLALALRQRLSLVHLRNLERGTNIVREPLECTPHRPIHTCSGPVASSAFLSSRILMNRGKRSEIPRCSTCHHSMS